MRLLIGWLLAIFTLRCCSSSLPRLLHGQSRSYRLHCYLWPVLVRQGRLARLKAVLLPP